MRSTPFPSPRRTAGRALVAVVLVVLAASSAGCGALKGGMGLAKQAPVVLDDLARAGGTVPRRGEPPIVLPPSGVDTAEQVAGRLETSSAFDDLPQSDALEVANLGCQAKDLYDIGMSPDLDSAAGSAILSFGGRPQFQNRVRELAEDLEEADSPFDAAGAAGVFAFCESVGAAGGG